MIDEKNLINFMKANSKQLFSAKELANIFNEDIKRIIARLNSLKKFDIIDIRKIDLMLARKIYSGQFKRPIKLYYYKE